MNEVIAPAPLKINFTELNVRQAGNPHFIRLGDSVVKRLERQLIDRPPVTGSERFGLLLGSIVGRDPCTIAVEDFEPTAKLEQSIGVWTPRPGSPQRIVGFYRSHREADFVLNPADGGLFERCFPKGSRLALLVRPAGVDVGTAMFFLGDNGQLALGRATVEFPFNLRELGAEDAPAAVSASVPAPKPAPPTPKTVASSEPAAPTPAEPASRRSGAVVKLAVAGAVVIASVFGLSELRLFQGSVGRPQAQTESKPIAEQRAVKEKPAPPKRQTVGPTTTATKLAALPKKSSDASAVPATAKPELVPQDAPLSPPVVPQQELPASTQPRPVNPAPPPPNVVSERQPVVPIEATPVTPAPKPAEISVPVTPPRAIRQLAPVLPDRVRKNMTGELVVRVKASVNAAGKVTSVEPVVGGDSIPDALAINAVNAVKQWQFEPARRGDEKVAGDIVLSFTFRK